MSYTLLPICAHNTRHTPHTHTTHTTHTHHTHHTHTPHTPHTHTTCRVSIGTALSTRKGPPQTPHARAAAQGPSPLYHQHHPPVQQSLPEVDGASPRRTPWILYQVCYQYPIRPGGCQQPLTRTFPSQIYYRSHLQPHETLKRTLIPVSALSATSSHFRHIRDSTCYWVFKIQAYSQPNHPS